MPKFTGYFKTHTLSMHFFNWLLSYNTWSLSNSNNWFDNSCTSYCGDMLFNLFNWCWSCAGVHMNLKSGELLLSMFSFFAANYSSNQLYSSSHKFSDTFSLLKLDELLNTFYEMIISWESFIVISMKSSLRTISVAADSCNYNLASSVATQCGWGVFKHSEAKWFL